MKCLGSPASALVFTCVDKAVIDGDWRRFLEADKYLKGVQKREGPWKFGISAGAFPHFLDARDYELSEDVRPLKQGDDT